MPINNKPLDSISEADLRELVENQVQEGKTIEYKESLPGTSSEERREFLADVSSLANSVGGHLIFGIGEQGA